MQWVNRMQVFGPMMDHRRHQEIKRQKLLIDSYEKAIDDLENLKNDLILQLQWLMDTVDPKINEGCPIIKENDNGI